MANAKNKSLNYKKNKQVSLVRYSDSNEASRERVKTMNEEKDIDLRLVSSTKDNKEMMANARKYSSNYNKNKEKQVSLARYSDSMISSSEASSEKGKAMNQEIDIDLRPSRARDNIFFDEGFETREDNSLSDSMKKALQYGYTFQNKELFPICNHKRRKLFNFEAISEYANKNLVQTSTLKTDIISGRTQDEFIQDFSLKLGMDANVIAPVAKAEFHAHREFDKGHENHLSTSVSQKRLQVTKTFLNVDICASDLNDLRRLLDPDAYEYMTNICTPGGGVSFLKWYGQYYLGQVHFGGLRTHDTEENKSSHSRMSKKSTNCRGGIGNVISKASLSCLCSNTEKKNSSKDDGKSLGATIGGDLSIGNEEVLKWIKSINTRNYGISQCSFQPIYWLLDINSEEMSGIRECLKVAHYYMIATLDEYFQQSIVLDKKRYLIYNEAYEHDNYHINSTLDEAGNIFMEYMDKSSDTKKEDDNPVEAFFDEKRGLDFTVFHNCADAYGGSDHTALSVSFEFKRRYLGRRNFWFMRNQILRLSDKSDRLDKKNHWCLKKIPHSTKCFILTPDQRYMLGIKRIFRNVRSDRFRLIFTLWKYRAESSGEYPSNFLWRFARIHDPGEEINLYDILKNNENARLEFTWRDYVNPARAEQKVPKNANNEYERFASTRHIVEPLGHLNH